jgi:FkbM family methyltransferase
MTFISYAQNFEDVILWRALKEIKNGFYVDVGAWSPDIDSVTKLFYENNWSGINIEPNSEFHGLCSIRRPRDLNLNMAVGDREGSILINIMSNPGLSTAVEEFAELHKSAGWSSHRQEVPITTLKTIFRQNLQSEQSIHFLKVDVEGLEEAVLRGNDWKNFRPWVVVVEATLPMTQTESYEEWAPILLNAGYIFAYADGLNRFYVAIEHEELLPAFKYPPNVFDDFLLSSQLQLEAKALHAEHSAQQAEIRAQGAEHSAQQAEIRAQGAEHSAHQAEIRVQQAEHNAYQAEIRAQQAEIKAQQANDNALQCEVKSQQAESAAHIYILELQAVYNSTSWRICAPLRWQVHQWRLLRQHGIKARIKALVKKILLVLLRFVAARPLLKSWTLKLLYRFGLAERIRPFVMNLISPPAGGTFPVANLCSEINHTGIYLDKRAARILADLKKEIKGENV